MNATFDKIFNIPPVYINKEKLKMGKYEHAVIRKRLINTITNLLRTGSFCILVVKFAMIKRP